MAAEIVLRSLREAIPSRWPAKVEELRSLRRARPDIDLAEFLDETGLELDDVYAGAKSWSDLRAAAGAPVAARRARTRPTLRRAVGRLLHVDDDERIAAYRRLLARRPAPSVDAMPERERRLAPHARRRRRRPGASPRTPASQEALDLLWAHPQVRAELRELFGVLDDRIDHLHAPLATHPDVPLQVHARYTPHRDPRRLRRRRPAPRSPPGRPASTRPRTPTPTCSPSRSTRPAAASPRPPATATTPSAATLIHWESQSITRADSETGLRYRNHERDGRSIMLFTRLRADDRAFWFLGPATLRPPRRREADGHHLGTRPPAAGRPVRLVRGGGGPGRVARGAPLGQVSFGADSSATALSPLGARLCRAEPALWVRVPRPTPSSTNPNRPLPGPMRTTRRQARGHVELSGALSARPLRPLGPPRRHRPLCHHLPSGTGGSTRYSQPRGDRLPRRSRPQRGQASSRRQRHRGMTVEGKEDGEPLDPFHTALQVGDN